MIDKELQKAEKQIASSKKGNRWGCWCRVSTVKQAKKDISLPDQENQAVKYIENHDCWTIADEHRFIDQVSGRKMLDSPEWRRLHQSMKRGEIDGLVTESASRLGRKAIEALQTIDCIINDYGVRLVLLKSGGEINLNDPMSNLNTIIQVGFSEFQYDTIIGESREGLIEKLTTKGERNLGRPLYGQRWSKDKKSRELDPETAPKVRLVIELRLELGWSYERIANFLNGEFEDRKGERIAKRNKIELPTIYRKSKREDEEKSIAWDRHRVGYICSRNAEQYCLRKGKLKYKYVEDDNLSYSCPNIITRDEYNQLKKVLPQYIDGRPRQPHLLSNILRCGLCGSRLHHNIIANKYKGKKQIYNYYICRNKLEKPNNGERCKLRSVPQEWLEREVWLNLTRLFSNQEHFEKVVFQTNLNAQKDSERLDDINEKLSAIAEEVKDIDDKVRNLVRFVAQGDVSGGIAKSEITRLRDEKIRLRDKKNDLLIEAGMIRREGATVEKLEKTRMWWHRYASVLKDEEKRKLTDFLVEEIVVYPFKQFDAEIPGDKEAYHKYKYPAFLERPTYWDPEDCRTPAIVDVLIKGKIPLLDNDFYRSTDKSKCLSAGK